jgi:hypothetical protein
MINNLTILVSSTNKPTLARALASLQVQSNSNWTALIGFNGCKPTELPKYSKFTYVYLNGSNKATTKEEINKNVLIRLAMTDWVCFLNDTDTFCPNYVDVFEEELSANPDADCIVFKINEKHLMHFANTETNIPFAVKKQFLENNSIWFSSNNESNFETLRLIYSVTKKIVFSNKSTYNIDL